MATMENRDMSPETRRNFGRVLQDVLSGEVKREPGGKLRLVHADVSRPQRETDEVETLAGQESEGHTDTEGQLKAILDLIQFCKDNPQELSKSNPIQRSVVFEKSKIQTDEKGQYVEAVQYKQLGQALGSGNTAEGVVAVLDMGTGTDHAMKTMMMAKFRKNEVKTWVDLGPSDRFPSLYMFRLDGDKIYFHMEKLDEAVTFDDVINEHMGEIHMNDPALAAPFSLCVFHDLLSALNEMHEKGIVHGDVHGGNAMIMKETMKVKLLDFGNSRRTERNDDDGLKYDILNAAALLCRLFRVLELTCKFELGKHMKDKTLETVLSEAKHLSEKDRKELLQLLLLVYDVVSRPEMGGYRSTRPIMENLERTFPEDERRRILRKAAAVLFPNIEEEDIDMKVAKEETGEATAPRQAPETGGQAEKGKEPLHFLGELTKHMNINISPVEKRKRMAEENTEEDPEGGRRT